MAETAGSLRTAILRRIRDPDGTAHAAVDVRTILACAQRLVNARTRAVQTTFAFNRNPNQPFTALDNSPHISSVRCNGRELQMIDWQSLIHHDPYWFRRTADTPTVWSLIGRTTLLVWPSPTFLTGNVNVTRTFVSGAFANDGIATNLPDQHMPAILDIVEQCLLARQRLFGSLKQASEKQTARMAGGRAT